MIETIRMQKRYGIAFSFLLFIIGICAFSDNAATSIIFYGCSVVYAAFCILEIISNRWVLKLNAVIKANILFWSVLAFSILWQYSSAYYATRLMTVGTIVFFCILTAQWLKSKDDINIAIACMVWGNVFNCLYRFAIGGIQEVMGTYVSSHPLIVGANDVGVMMVIVCAFAIYLFREWHKKRYIVAAVLFFAMGAMTASRKALIGLFLIVIIQYALKDRHIFRNILIASLIVIIMWLLLSKIDFFSYSLLRIQQLIGFINESTTIVDDSSIIRQQMRQIGLAAFLEKPILGYGVGYSYTNLANGTYLHNNYIEVGVSLGILGLSTFYLPHLAIIKKLLFLRNNQILKLTCGSIIVALFIVDYGAVTYFNKFSYITLVVLYAMLQVVNKKICVVDSGECDAKR